MQHDLFGTLNYKDEAWQGQATLPGLLPGPAAPVRVLINDPDKEGPTEHQEEAGKHLMAKAADVMRAVGDGLFKSYQDAYAQEDWRETCGLTPAKSLADVEDYELREVQIHLDHHKGVAFLAFFFEAAWGGDGDLYVVYHPNKPTQWVEPSALIDVIESDEPGEEFVPSPSQELVDAILEGNDKKAKALIAGGMSINDLAPDECPPLWVAVSQMQPELVRRLLAYGADPALKDPSEKTTPLQSARKMYREMGFAPSTKKNDLADLMSMIPGAAGAQFAMLKTQLEEMMQMLEAAGAK